MRRRTPRLAAAVLAVAALALGACSGGAPDQPQPGTSAAGFPVTVGGVTLDARPDRIVVLSPTATEMIFAIGAGDQVVAVDDNSNYPPQAPRTDLSAFTPNAEAISAQEPDLVVISDDMNKIVEQLGALRIPVYQAPAAAGIGDTYDQITDLGKLTGHAPEADALVKRMKEDITLIMGQAPNSVEPLKFYYELGPELYSATSVTFIGSLFSQLGLINVADAAGAQTSGGYPQLSQEIIVEHDPDLIFLADTKCCQQNAETVAARPGWETIKAVRQGHVIELDDDIASRWGPRVVDLLRTVVEALAQVPS